MGAMNISSLTSSLASYGLDSLISRSSNTQTTGTSTLTDEGSSTTSDLASYMQQLSELQQSDPDKFSELTAQISEQLQSAADAAESSGDTNQANALSDLADKFSAASESGEMPDLRPSGPPPMGPPPESSDDSTSSSDSELLSKMLSAYTSSSTTSSGDDPMGTLSDILKDVFSSVSSTTAS
jgi:hypothetical protein